MGVYLTVLSPSYIVEPKPSQNGGEAIPKQSRAGQSPPFARLAMPAEIASGTSSFQL